METKEYIEAIYNAAAVVKELIAGRQPEVGIVLGSGLGHLADKITDPVTIPYRNIPGFPVSTAIGHKGNFICGQLGGKCVLAMQGRFHYYEGYSMQMVTIPIRVMHVLGIRNLFVSNAAGGVNFDYKVGDLVILRDQISLQPNPLIGPNLDDFGPRFPDMTRPYDIKLRKLALDIARESGIKVREGVYLADTGPSFETPAEYNFYRMVGADLVGMSTAAEVAVARHQDMRVFGMSVVTNEAKGDFAEDFVNDANDVLKAANAASEQMCEIFEKLIETL